MRLEMRELLKISFGVSLLAATACGQAGDPKVFRYYAVEEITNREPITDTIVLHVKGDSVWLEETLMYGHITGTREISLPVQIQKGALGGRYPVEGQITFSDRDWQGGFLSLRLKKSQNSLEQHRIKFLLEGVD
jgi:hypothetical protein